MLPGNETFANAEQSHTFCSVLLAAIHRHGAWLPLLSQDGCWLLELYRIGKLYTRPLCTTYISIKGNFFTRNGVRTRNWGRKGTMRTIQLFIHLTASSQTPISSFSHPVRYPVSQYYTYVWHIQQNLEFD